MPSFSSMGLRRNIQSSWEIIYMLAKEQFAENLCLEVRSQSKRGLIRHQKILK